MACRKTLTLSEGGDLGDTPLDNAVIGTSALAGGEFLWAVRGGRVFKYNSSTGAKLADSVFDPYLFPNSAIAFDPSGDVIYCVGYNRMFSDSTSNFTNNYPAYLWSIHPGTLATIGSVNMTILSGWGNFSHSTTTGSILGTQSMFFAANGLWGAWHFNELTLPFRYVPSSPFNRGVGFSNNRTNGFSGVDWDGIDRFFYADVWNQSIRAYIMTDDVVGAWNDDASYNCWSENSTIPFGVAYDLGSTDIFLGLQNGTIKRVSYNQGTSTIALVANIATGLSGTIFKMSYNPYDGLIYGVSISEGKVFTVNPDDNSVAVNAATFTLPWEVVFNASHNWIVTRGNTGIVELT